MLGTVTLEQKRTPSLAPGDPGGPALKKPRHTGDHGEARGGGMAAAGVHRGCATQASNLPRHREVQEGEQKQDSCHG